MATVDSLRQSVSPGHRRILFLVWQYHPVPAGGAEHQARLQAEELVRRGHSVTVVCRRTPGAHSGIVNGVAVWRLPAIDRHPFRTVSLLASLTVYLLFTLRRFDLVHVHLAGVYTDLVVLIASLFRVPVYLKIAAGGESGEVRKLRRIASVTRYYGLRHAARVQALSDEIAEELRGVGVRDDRIVRLPNGVVMSPVGGEQNAARARLRSDLGLPATGLIALYMGRFSRYKGVADLVEAWREVTVEDAHLLLVGYRADQPPEDQLEITPDGTRDDAVLVHPWTTRASDYLGASDVFVLPSHSEGMSNALLEAMAAGRAVISTRVGAATALIEDNGNGLLVDVGNPSQLADALTRLLASDELRGRLGAAATATVEREYAIASVVARIEAEYEAAIRR